MYRYRIIKNGFFICMAKGKKDAVKRIEQDIHWYTPLGIRKWKVIGEDIRCTCGLNEYETLKD
jgi:hypothetical protein